MEQLGEKVKELRIKKGWTQEHLTWEIDVSLSTVQRWERQGAKPTRLARRELAKPLGFSEPELFTLANYLTPKPSITVESEAQLSRLDPYVAEVLSQESVEMQRAVFGILNILTNLAKTFARK